jgi:hypothetical protein
LSCCMAWRQPCCPRRRRDGEDGLVGWAGKGKIKAPRGERRSGAGERGITNTTISVEERGGDEQTPVMVDFAEPMWTEQEHTIRAVVGCERFILVEPCPCVAS